MRVIYGRWGSEVTIVRVGTESDVRDLDNRKPDAHDRQRIADGCYLVTKSADDGRERLHDVAYLRADDGIREIMDAVRALPSCQACSVHGEHDRCTGETTLGTQPCACRAAGHTLEVPA